MTTYQQTSQPNIGRLRNFALIAGVVGLALCAVGYFLGGEPIQFLTSYLYAYLFWLGLSLGSMAAVMLFHVTGGGWGYLIRRIVETGALMVMLMAPLFIPIILGMHELYHWTHTEEVLADKVLSQKTWYLNETFFYGRAVLYFVVWIGLALLLNRLSRRQEQVSTSDPRVARRLRDLSRGGLILYMLTMTFAAFDWAMSLEPHWYSTIFGAMFVAGQALSTIAFAIVIVRIMMNFEPFRSHAKLDWINDLGNLMLGFTVLWTYMSFSQFFLIWGSNIPEEATWYNHRQVGGWTIVGAMLILLHFALPLLILMVNRIKRNVRLLALVALLILVMRHVDLFYIVTPTFFGHIQVHWLDLATTLAIGGFWLAGFATLLLRRPLLLHDPRYEGDSHGHH